MADMLGASKYNTTIDAALGDVGQIIMRAVWELHTKMLGGVGGWRFLFLLGNLQTLFKPHQNQ